ncbi:hypothetical protein [Nonomuraea dietziae]|uniref:hypothetical protein n=1 Tax=Nonomuraea dietziae TaxID=65515 RepID=UPI003449B6E1
MCGPADGSGHVLYLTAGLPDGSCRVDSWRVCCQVANDVLLQLGPPDETELLPAADPALDQDMRAVLDQAERDATNAVSALLLGVLDGPEGPVQVDADWGSQLSLDAARLAVRLTHSLRAAAAIASEMDPEGQVLLLDAIRGPLMAAEEER